MKSCSKERKVTKKRTLRQYLNQYTQLRRVRSAGCLSPPHSPIKKPSDPLSIFKDRTQQIIKIIEVFIKQKDVLGKVQEKLSSLVTLFQTNFEKKQNTQTRNAQKQKEIEVINQQYLLNIPQEPEVELIKSFEKSKQTSQTIQTSGSRKIQRKFAQDSLDLALVSSTPSQAMIGKSLNQNILAPPTKMSPILQKSLDFQLEDEPKIQQKRKKIYRKISSNIRLPTIPRLGSELNL